ncbi:MAG TPA: DUF2135 domain-containing protein, partial [Burkholderiaceae bacterium]
IRRLGNAFGMPTRETSLLVLERLDDYVRYDVAPPPELRAAYDALTAARGAQLRQRQTKQLDNVVRQFEEKVRWWEHKFPKNGAPVPVEPKAMQQQAAGLPRATEIAEPSRELRRAQPPLPSPIAQSTSVAPPNRDIRPAPPAPPAAAAPVTVFARASAPAAERAEAPSGPQAAPAASIALRKWTPDAAYIDRLKNASTADLYRIYLDEKPGYADSTAFFLDAADILLEKGQRALALRVLSNLAEMNLENRHVLRILGYRLMQAGAPELAASVFEKVRELAEEEPQSFRDLGLAYDAAGKPQQAIDQLYEVVRRPWDGRFAEIELIALAELNAIVAARRGLDTSRIDPRLLKNLPLDLRAVLTWDADNTDIDLWVTDPDGQRCYYAYPRTWQGGRMSRDFTGGYGPEEFSLRFAKPGKYKVEANFYGHRQQIVAGATTLQLSLTTGFGTRTPKTRSVTMRLQQQGERVYVGEIEIGGR